MDSALYYTFSTIAQTLAAAVALLAAFVLYRLQTLNSEIEERSDRVLQHYGGDDRRVLEKLHVGGRFDEVLSYSKRMEPKGTATEVVDRARPRLAELLGIKRGMLRWFRLSLVLTLGLIALSVGVLAATPAILDHEDAPLLVLRVGVGYFVLCLASYALLLDRAIR